MVFPVAIGQIARELALLLGAVVAGFVLVFAVGLSFGASAVTVLCLAYLVLSVPVSLVTFLALRALTKLSLRRRAAAAMLAALAIPLAILALPHC